MFYNDPYELGPEIWAGLLSDDSITYELDMKILRIVYESEKNEIRASEIVSKLNYYTHHGPINSEISRFSKRVVNKTGVQPPLRKDGKPRWWHVPFLGYENGNSFPWIMRPDLVTAFDRISNQNDTSILHSDEIAIDDYQQLNEGGTNQVLVNRYERNKHAQNICIAHYGNLCAVCGFDFERTYGPIGKNKIHVHHLIPLSKIQHQYNVNPVTDLRPICPNCHQIIHSKRDPFTIEEVKRMIGRS